MSQTTKQLKKPDKPTALYLRASSSKQDKSCGDQRKACVEYALANSYRILDTFEDNGISGFKHGKEGRESFSALLDFCRTPPMSGGYV